MPQALGRYISIDPEILGGTPVVSGTRIPVARLSQLVKQGYSLESVQEEYPWVNERKIQFLVAYLMEAGLNAFNKAQKI